MSKIAVTRYKNLTRWDVKTYLYTLDSHHPIVSLAPYLIENTNRVKPFDHPEQEFDILGVTNKNGIYFNETLFGSQINQPYYQVDSGDIFYNPYRVNVGSIGIVPKEFHHKYTSPAYVVFKTKSDELLSEYLLFVMRSDWFNDTLRAFTSGSVRQNLTFALLGELKIPLPSLAEQQQIVDLWKNAHTDSQNALNKAETLKKDIDDYLMSELGITVQKQEKSKVFTTRFKDLERWGTRYMSLNSVYHSNRYKVLTLGSLLLKPPQYGAGESAIDGNIERDYRYIRITDINDFGLLKNNTWQTAEKIEEHYHLNLDDILIARSGATVGKCYLHKDENLKAIYAGYLIRFIIDKTKISPEFFFYFTFSTMYKYWVLRQQRPMGQPNINAEEFSSLKIPLPPMEKQEEIVEHITDLRSQISKLTTNAQHTLETTRETIKKMIIS